MGMFKNSGVYDVKSLIQDVFLFGLMLVLMKTTGGVGFIVFFFMAVIAVMQNRTERLLVLMMVTCCAQVGNGNLMPKGTVFNAIQKIMMIIMAVSLTMKLSGRRHSNLVSPMLGLIPYLLFMVISSAQGWNPLISYLKLFLFVSCYFAYYSLANTIILDHRVSIEKVRSAYLSLCVMLVLGSIALIPFPGISQLNMDFYMKALMAGKEVKSLFCGMTFQPQALGPIVAIIFTVLLCDLLFSVRKTDKLIMLILLCCPYLIYKTSSRTAMGSLLAGAFFSVFLFMRMRRVNSRWKGKVVSCVLMIAIVASVGLLGFSTGREKIAKYVMKNAEITSLEGASMENVLVSRQALMDDSKSNFHESPFFGNGFQVSKDHIGRDASDLKSILSAPIEKGVWITAVLEEGGVVGFVLFVGFGIFAIIKLISVGAETTAATLFTIFVLNLGEFTFFSMSGIGGFYWCLCFIGAVFDAHRKRGLQQSFSPRGYNSYC